MRGIPLIQDYSMPTIAELPATIPSWQIAPTRAVLLVHDMQRFFLRPLPGALRSALVNNVVTLRDWAVAHQVPIAYTAQPGDMTSEQRGLLADFWGGGMRASTGDRQVVDPLTPTGRDWVFTKWRYSAFYRTELLASLRRHRRDQLILCGVYAHVGVQTTAVEAFSNDIETFFVADAVADFSGTEHRQALEYAAKRCAVVLTTEQVCR